MEKKNQRTKTKQQKASRILWPPETRFFLAHIYYMYNIFIYMCVCVN